MRRKAWNTFLAFHSTMRATIILSLLLLAACGPGEEAVTRGDVDLASDSTSGTETSAVSTTDAPRGAMETQSEAPLPDADTTGTASQSTTTHYRRTLRSRRAFAMTDTELKLMAAAATIGLRRTPNQG